VSNEKETHLLLVLVEKNIRINLKTKVKPTLS